MISGAQLVEASRRHVADSQNGVPLAERPEFEPDALAVLAAHVAPAFLTDYVSNGTTVRFLTESALIAGFLHGWHAREELGTQ